MANFVDEVIVKDLVDTSKEKYLYSSLSSGETDSKIFERLDEGEMPLTPESIHSYFRYV
jgi:hypothetical protein